MLLLLNGGVCLQQILVVSGRPTWIFFNSEEKKENRILQ
jgi:hypothetical protein